MPLDLDMLETDEIEPGEASAFAPIPEQPDDSLPPEDFYENLADVLSDSAQKALALQVIEDVRINREARKDWDQMLADGLESLGIDRSSDDRTEPFPGAASCSHPLMMSSAVDIQGRLMREMFPAKGPVSTEIIGRETPQKRDRAKRLEGHMNYQMTVEYPDYREDSDRNFMILPIAGDTTKKIWWDFAVNRWRADFIAPQDFIVPYGSKSLEDAPEYTHIMRPHTNDMRREIASGFWQEINLGDPQPDDDIDQSPIKEVNDRIDGIEQPQEADFAPHIVYESHRDLADPDLLALEGEGEDALPLPYIVTVHQTTQQILSIRRNWRPDDERKLKRVWFSHYKFMPWLGYYGIGLLHLIGGLGRAATGSMRAILDGAMIRTVPGGIRLKGKRVSGANLAFRPMEFTEVEAPGVTDVRNIAMPYPVNPSDPALFEMLGFLTQQGEKFANVATQAIMEANPQGAVGTTLALIEQGSIVYSEIHSRQHATLGRELRMIAELNGENLDDQVTVRTFGGEMIVSRMDYAADVDVIPVSDPSIFSQAQRAARSEAQLQLAKSAKEQGVPVDMAFAYRSVAEMLGFEEIDQLFPPQQQAKPLDPISELAAIVNGAPVDAFPGQAHMAHVQYLNGVTQDPQYQQLMQSIGPRMVSLINAHLLRQNQEEIMGMLQQQFQGQQPPPQVVAQAMAQAATMLAQQHQHQAQMAAQQQQPQDPLVAVAMEDVKRKAAADQQGAQIKIAQLQADKEAEAQSAQLKVADLQAKAAAAQQSDQIKIAELQSKLRLQEQKDALDHHTEAARIALDQQNEAAKLETEKGVDAAKIASAERIAFAKMANDRELQDSENQSDLDIAEKTAAELKVST